MAKYKDKLWELSNPAGTVKIYLKAQMNHEVEEMFINIMEHARSPIKFPPAWNRWNKLLGYLEDSITYKIISLERAQKIVVIHDHEPNTLYNLFQEAPSKSILKIITTRRDKNGGKTYWLQTN